MTTIRDVAKLAGVAPTTVSRVMNNSGYVSAATRQRVEAAAAELHFEPNLLASGLKSRRTRTIALVLTDITNPFWTSVARAVEDEASSEGYTVIFCNTDEDDTKQDQYLSMLVQRRVDGVLLVPASNSGKTVQKLQAQGVHVVVLDRQVEGVDVDIVRGDSVQGAHALMSHLLSLGHRRVGMLAGPTDVSAARDRVRGYRLALAEAKLDVDETLVRYGRFTVESGDTMTRELLTLVPRPTALFAANNFIAVGAMRALHNAGLRVPDDMSLVAFDDLPDTYMQAPILTVAVQPTYELGTVAAKLLLDRLKREAPRRPTDVLLATELIVRASTRRLEN
jgi:LacI family transcriptional regulator